MSEASIDRAGLRGGPLFRRRWLAHPLRMGSWVPSSATTPAVLSPAAKNMRSLTGYVLLNG